MGEPDDEGALSGCWAGAASAVESAAMKTASDKGRIMLADERTRQERELGPGSTERLGLPRMGFCVAVGQRPRRSPAASCTRSSNVTFIVVQITKWGSARVART